jgi:hypothetical protein
MDAAVATFTGALVFAAALLVYAETRTAPSRKAPASTPPTLLPLPPLAPPLERDTRARLWEKMRAEKVEEAEEEEDTMVLLCERMKGLCVGDEEGAALAEERSSAADVLAEQMRRLRMG